MTLGDLKRIAALNNIPDSTVIVSPGTDHSYNKAVALFEKAELVRGLGYFEYYDERNRTATNSTIETVMVVR